jgi:hypothetical protein
LRQAAVCPLSHPSFSCICAFLRVGQSS